MVVNPNPPQTPKPPNPLNPKGEYSDDVFWVNLAKQFLRRHARYLDLRIVRGEGECIGATDMCFRSSTALEKLNGFAVAVVLWFHGHVKEMTPRLQYTGSRLHTGGRIAYGPRYGQTA